MILLIGPLPLLSTHGLILFLLSGGPLGVWIIANWPLVIVTLFLAAVGILGQHAYIRKEQAKKRIVYFQHVPHHLFSISHGTGNSPFDKDNFEVYYAETDGEKKLIGDPYVLMIKFKNVGSKTVLAEDMDSGILICMPPGPVKILSEPQFNCTTNRSIIRNIRPVMALDRKRLNLSISSIQPGQAFCIMLILDGNPAGYEVLATMKAEGSSIEPAKMEWSGELKKRLLIYLIAIAVFGTVIIAGAVINAMWGLIFFVWPAGVLSIRHLAHLLNKNQVDDLT